MYGKAYAGLDLGGGVMAIPGGVYDIIADYYDREIPSELTRGQIRNILEMVIPAYHVAVVQKGIPTYTYAPESSANRELFEYITTATSQTRDVVQDCLFSLEQCTILGRIDGKYLRPDTWSEVKPPSSLEELLRPATEGFSLTSALGSSFNKLLIGAGVVIIAVILGKTAIRSAIK